MNTYLAAAVAAVAAFAVTCLLGFIMIPWLRRLKFGQTISEVGPVWRKNRPGTPTMGGIIFIIGSLSSLAVVLVTDKFMGGDIVAGENVVRSAMYTKLLAGIVMALTLALTGFADDYIRTVGKQNFGLSVRQKALVQLLTILAYLASMRLAGCSYMYVPFYGVTGELGIVFFLLGLGLIYGTVNSVAVTDGADGLCTSVTLTSAVALAVITFLRNNTGAGVAAAALAGGCAGFLVWNTSPAKVTMGNTGSMFLGGMVAALAYAADCPLIILPVGIVFFVEGLLYAVRTGSFRLPGGKRISKPAALHRQLKAKGWKENKIAAVFTAVNIIGCAVGTALIYFG